MRRTWSGPAKNADCHATSRRKIRVISCLREPSHKGTSASISKTGVHANVPRFMPASPSPFNFAHESDCLKVQAIGRYFIEQREAAAEAIAALIKSRPTRAALVDLRCVPGPFSFMDRVKWGEAAGRYLAGTPIAVVLDKAQADPDNIGMVVARNRGANVEIFTDEAEAQTWLHQYLTPST